ncbi:MAG: hypothetical protein ABI574_07105 [Burkholderiales bacterium]
MRFDGSLRASIEPELLGTLGLLVESVELGLLIVPAPLGVFEVLGVSDRLPLGWLGFWLLRAGSPAGEPPAPPVLLCA